MLHFYRNSILCLFIVIPVSASAMSGQFDADAVVTMRNGNPCFSYPPNKEKLFGYHLIVSKRNQHRAYVWEIQVFNYDNLNVPEPNGPETCIEYAVVNHGVEVKLAAEPLLPNVPYQVYMSVAEAPTGRQRYRYLRKFAADFCISNNEHGEPIIVGASGGGMDTWRCLKPGESSKRGFWQRLFGK